MRRLPPIETDKKGTDPLARRRCQIESFLILQRLKRSVEERTQAHFRSQALVGITPAQANVLMVLFQRRRAMTAREVHDELGISEVTVSRLVSALVNNEWVSKARNPADGRAALLSPTDKARAHLGSFIQIANVLLDETFHGIDDEALVVLNQSIRRIDENLGSKE